MRFWDPTGPEFEAADAQPWDGPLAGVMRPFSTRSLIRMMLAGALLYVLSGTGGLVLALTTRAEAHNSGQLAAFNVTAIALGLAQILLLLLMSPSMTRRLAGVGALVLVGTSSLVVTGDSLPAGLS